MTVIIHIGRRVPRSWFKRRLGNIKGLITFQEHIWTMIKMSLTNAKKKATRLKKNNSGKISKFVIQPERENEGINYQIEWLKIIIQGEKKAEEEEYNESMDMYKKFKDVLKKNEIPKDNKFGKMMNNSKVLSQYKIEDAYKKGHGATSNNNIANKLLEMGILTHIEWLDDFESRKGEIYPDFG